ncbi:hypothetical protein E2C01_003514 [Portunus trituberculatus]|uniref:Uncharacterized protein n=1 Tax=Portunus trituberculatus TaxID=210409 RepID=A0A5B7CN03_PORTR|nr:hypothetical protein [Portunus trituberculatus]
MIINQSIYTLHAVKSHIQKSPLSENPHKVTLMYTSFSSLHQHYKYAPLHHNVSTQLGVTTTNTTIITTITTLSSALHGLNTPHHTHG